MKRTFEITYPDRLSEFWMNTDHLLLCLKAAWPNTTFQVNDVTPEDPVEGSMADLVEKAKVSASVGVSAKMAAVAKAVVAESLEEMAKPYASHTTFTNEAKRLRSLLEPPPEPTLTRNDCGKAARDNPPYANCPCSHPRQCVWAPQKGH